MSDLFDNKVSISQKNQARYRIAIVISHFIQYHAPLFRMLASNPQIDLTVFVCSRHGADSCYDLGFGRVFSWDRPVTVGYRWELLTNWRKGPPSAFWSCINPSIINRLRRGGFDAVWVHGWADVTTWLGILTALIFDIPLLVRGEARLALRESRLKSLAKRLILAPILRRASGVLTIGKLSCDYYRHYGIQGHRQFLTPYAVDNDYFISKAQQLGNDRMRLKAGLGLDAGRPLILFSGKLIPRKRPFDLLHAQQCLENQASLVLLGDGILRPALEIYAHEHRIQNVYFAGFKNQTELCQYFAAADIFVLPSEFETWGLVVNEAMCFGLPVIISDGVGAGPDLVEHGANGFVYPAGNIDRLVAYLRQMFLDENMRVAMGCASFEKIKAWSYVQDVAGVLACLQSLPSAV